MENNKFDTSKINEKDKKNLEDFINSGGADEISKKMDNIDKEKVLKMFSSLSSEDIKKALSGGLKNLDMTKLNQFMKGKGDKK